MYFSLRAISRFPARGSPGLVSMPHRETSNLHNPISEKLKQLQNRFHCIHRGLLLNSTSRNPIASLAEVLLPVDPRPQRLRDLAICSSLDKSNPAQTGLQRTMDGTVDRILGRSPKPEHVASIFVHAGAGYHSTTNEHIHLAACNE